MAAGWIGAGRGPTAAWPRRPHSRGQPRPASRTYRHCGCACHGLPTLSPRARFIGFDAVSTLAEETKNPAVDMPVGPQGQGTRGKGQQGNVWKGDRVSCGELSLRIGSVRHSWVAMLLTGMTRGAVDSGQG
jgi:hypothetical protein